jgi:hypothetical protein
MPQTIKQEDGTEIEVFTSDEVKAQVESQAGEILNVRLAEERERIEIEKEAELLEKDEALANTKAELEKLQKKDMNFEALRKSKTLTPEQEEAAKKTSEELSKLQETVAQIQKQPLEAAKAQFVASNIGTDKDLNETFDFFYKKLSVGVKTLDEVNTALVAAFNAATAGTRQPNDSRITRVGISDNYHSLNTEAESEASREFGAMLGLSQEDKKAYGQTVQTGRVNLFARPASK